MSVMAVTKRTIELPTGGLVGVVRGDNLRTRCQGGSLMSHGCHIAPTGVTFGRRCQEAVPRPPE
jgi:hypothetical protein